MKPQMFLRPTSVLMRLSAFVIGSIWACAGAVWTYHVLVFNSDFPTERSNDLCFAVLAAGLLLVASALLPSKRPDFESETPDLHTDLDGDD